MSKTAVCKSVVENPLDIFRRLSHSRLERSFRFSVSAVNKMGFQFPVSETELAILGKCYKSSSVFPRRYSDVVDTELPIIPSFLQPITTSQNINYIPREKPEECFVIS